MVQSRQPKTGALRRGGFQIVEIPRLLLEFLQTLAHMVQYPKGELTTGDGAYVLTEKIQAGLVAADNADGGEVITPIELKAPPNLAQVIAGIGIESFFSESFEYFAFDLQTRFGNLH